MKTIITLLIAVNILFLFELFGVKEIVLIALAIEAIYFLIAYLIESKTHVLGKWLNND